MGRPDAGLSWREVGCLVRRRRVPREPSISCGWCCGDSSRWSGDHWKSRPLRRSSGCTPSCGRCSAGSVSTCTRFVVPWVRVRHRRHRREWVRDDAGRFTWWALCHTLAQLQPAGTDPQSVATSSARPAARSETSTHSRMSARWTSSVNEAVSSKPAPAASARVRPLRPARHVSVRCRGPAGPFRSSAPCHLGSALRRSAACFVMPSPPDTGRRCAISSSGSPWAPQWRQDRSDRKPGLRVRRTCSSGKGPTMCWCCSTAGSAVHRCLGDRPAELVYRPDVDVSVA